MRPDSAANAVLSAPDPCKDDAGLQAANHVSLEVRGGGSVAHQALHDGEAHPA